MIKSISIILTRVTWSSFLEAAPELSYYQNIIWKWRRCWISHWLSTLSVGISLSISNFEQQIGNPHRKFKQQGCEIIVSYNMGKIFWTQENDCQNLFSSRSYKSLKFEFVCCQILPLSSSSSGQTGRTGSSAILAMLFPSVPISPNLWMSQLFQKVKLDVLKIFFVSHI